MKYEDFQIEIGSREGSAPYPVRMRAPDGGGGTGTFANPFAPEPTSWREGRPRGDLERLAREAGETLFAALFSDHSLRALLDRALGGIEARGDDEERGLRLRLTLLADAPADFRELDSLPWELLRRAPAIGHLADRRITPVVRSPMMPVGVRRTKLPSRLRVLVVGANPQEHPPLDLAAEMEKIRQALAKHSRVEAVFLNDSDPEGRISPVPLQIVRETLLAARREGNPFQVLHFMGHGYLDPASGLGGVLFEDPQGNADFVDGETLAGHLQDLSLRLVVLNSCYGADAGSEAFGGVARSLLLGDIPAVIAVRDQIDDLGAGAFGGALYRALAAGDPVDTAVTEGRLAIREALRNGSQRQDLPPDWARPRLYLRGQDGELFRFRSRRVEVNLGQPSESGRLRALQEAVADFVDIPAASVKIESPAKAGLRLVLELPEELAKELASAHRRGDPALEKILRPAGVRSVTVLPLPDWPEWLLLTLPFGIALLDALVLKRPHWTLQSSRAIDLDLPGEPLAALLYYLGLTALAGLGFLLTRHVFKFWRPSPILPAALLALVLGLAFFLRPIPKVDNLQPLTGRVDPKWGLSSYLFIKPIESEDCWLQGPVPLATHQKGRWSTLSRFAGPPGQRFEIRAVASRNPLHPGVVSQPDSYPCSVIPTDSDQAIYLVELR